MALIYTWPSQKELADAAQTTPSYMGPNIQPAAVIVEEAFSKSECNDIMSALLAVKNHQFPLCGAMTQEIGWNPVLRELERFGHLINSQFWQYDLDWDTFTWLQTYQAASEYRLHMDMAPGQMRKMTAVMFLSNPDEYEGGELELFYQPESFKVPRTQGTVVCFQPWILHRVHAVESGHRRTLNMGYWGPNFK